LFSHALSFLVALAITAAAFAGRAVWIAFLGIFFVYINGSFLLRTLQAHRDQKLRPQLDKIKEAVDKGETDLALELIAKVQKRAKSPDTKREAARLLIFLHLKLENYEQAEIELRRSTVLFGEDPFLQGMLHFRKGETTAAIPHLRAIFDSWPQKESGLMLHQSLIADKDFVGALELCAHPALAEVKQATCVDLQVEAFKNEQFKISVQAGLLAYEHKADANVAFNLACALARDAQLEAALKWLRVAVDSGFNNKEALLSDPDIEAVRSLPEFGSIVAKADKIGD
jgi:tetratricopeptide (TPR) repeat protein